MKYFMSFSVPGPQARSYQQVIEAFRLIVEAKGGSLHGPGLEDTDDGTRMTLVIKNRSGGEISKATWSISSRLSRWRLQYVIPG
jgi:hypothetical protein